MQTKKKKSLEQLKLLTDEILQLDIEYSHSFSQDLLKKRLLLQTEFNILSTQQAEYLISKSRSTYYEHGEKAGRLLAWQVRQHSAGQDIPVINNDQGRRCCNNSEINACFSKFYQLLYTSESSLNAAELEAFFKDVKIPSVNSDLSDELEKDFSLEEISSAIKSMQSGKALGPDGFPTEFFNKNF